MLLTEKKNAMEIRLKRVTKSFDKRQVIHPTTLTIENGSFTTLLGPSDCGKTTLLRMIAGLETPDDGEIWLDDTCVFSKKRRINLPPEKRRLGFVFQDFALWPHRRYLKTSLSDCGQEKIPEICRAVSVTPCAPCIWRTTRSATPSALRRTAAAGRLCPRHRRSARVHSV